MSVIGEPITRVDGKLKVTGGAKYSGDFAAPKLCHAVVILSTIPNGRIAGLDTAEAEKAPGVVAVLKPGSAPKLPKPESRLALLQDDQVHYNNQPIALIVAETLHQAAHASSLVRVRYETNPPKLDFFAEFPNGRSASHNNEPGDMAWGDVDAGLAQAQVVIDEVYTTPIQHHNPMEPHATMAQWEGDHLTVHDATQHITGVQDELAEMFGISKENVHVITLFVGGGFGCKGQMWSHVALAAMAAKQVNRPVKLVLERPQMFGSVGARPRTYQQLKVGATRDGKLTAIRHEVHTNTSVIEDYLESSAFPTRVMYSCPNVATISRIVPLNLGTPTYMRAPGVATGTYALEVAMDELAYRLNIDPLELRLRNYADVDPHTKLPFSEKSLRECYTRGAARFGWSKRNPQVGAMRDGNLRIGWGMATETYPAHSLPAAALARWQPDGRVVVESGTQEIGTGIYTIMAQVAADALGISLVMVTVKIGDTKYPEGPISAGSMSTASITPAVQAAASDLKRKIVALASADEQSPLHGASMDEVEFKDGKIFRTSAPERSESVAALLVRNGGRPVEGMARVKPPDNEKKYSSHSFGAIFAEVAVDPNLGESRVRRVVAVYDVGKVLNAKTGHSQFVGGIVWGISLALHEDSHVDERYGRFTNANLAQYLVPVNADIPEIDVSVTDIPDTKLDPLGARGIGEIGITGTGAAVSNAIYHATGKRVRDLPITPDKLLS